MGGESNSCLAACRTQYMGYILYPWCSRMIEVEPRRTPVGVYTLVECRSDLMRRVTISRSRSRNRIHRRFVVDFPYDSPRRIPFDHFQLSCSFASWKDTVSFPRTRYYAHRIISLPSFRSWTFFSRREIRRAKDELTRFRGEKISREWRLLS